jgi:hypothetical protein
MDTDYDVLRLSVEPAPFGRACAQVEVPFLLPLLWASSGREPMQPRGTRAVGSSPISAVEYFYLNGRPQIASYYNSWAQLAMAHIYVQPRSN